MAALRSTMIDFAMDSDGDAVDRTRYTYGQCLQKALTNL